ncbi:MAG: TIGR01906 family membrane protein [Lachnospiraceae bacterium]|nr:TIGR01906 family membrane protein [Lachnospiraceae bacterium]
MSKNVYDTDTFRGTDILIGIFFFLALVGLGLFIAVNFRPIYYGCINRYGIEEVSGLSREEIILNYDALIDYCFPLNFGELHFPTLKSSVSGLSHFAEVKVLFNIFYVVGFISTIITVMAFISRLKEKEIRFLKVCSITSLVIPGILVLFTIIDFDRLFVLFHKLMFNNDDWLFDPELDPVIRILPEEFFMICLIVIAGTVILGSCVTMGIYMYKKHKKKLSGGLLPKEQNFYY